MKNKDTIEMNRTNRLDFQRMKLLLACASKDPTRSIINKVLVKKAAAGVTITATDGRRMRIDHFMIEAAAGIYDIKVNSGSGIFLMRNKEKLTFPKTEQVIPSLDPLDAYLDTRKVIGKKADRIVAVTHVLSLMKHCGDDTVPVSPAALANCADLIDSELCSILEYLDDFIFPTDAEAAVDEPDN